ncbi:MAG: TlpA family protein disulfide reductase [Armatimonadetes bacterium]|nr:TlpA family protein disulfide reductase [Armatimonadota bacterium]
MNKSFRKLALAAGIVGLVASAVLAQGLPKGSKAPDFSVRDIKGGTFKLSSYKGKVVFLNFWATWCPPCRAEFPEIVKLNNAYAKKGVKIASVSVDQAGKAEAVKQFAQDRKATQQVLYGSTAGKAFEDYANDPRAGIPMNVLIGKDGKVIKTWVGYSGEGDAKDWKAEIDTALKAKTK